MQLHQLQPKTRSKGRKRVGRGGKRGTYSGKGMKGQNSRAGMSLKPFIRDWIKKYPKLRGYRFNPRNTQTAVVNTADLERVFEPGEKVNPRALLERKIIRRIKGGLPNVKILGRGKLTKKLIIEECQASKGAEEQIKKAGGKFKL